MTATTTLVSAPDEEPKGKTIPFGARMSISSALNGSRNSLGLIRLILATSVILSHAFPLSGAGGDPLWQISRGQVSVGSIAVAGFFAISGYLITKSGYSTDVVQFIWRRVLRIFPAFWLVLLVTALLVGPVLWVAQTGRIEGYFTTSEQGPLGYLARNWWLEIGTYGIYDLLQTTTPYGISTDSSAFNGSLWTLIYEWHCYLAVAVLVVFGILRNARIVVPTLAGVLFVLQLVATADITIVGRAVPFLADPHLLNLGFVFACGAVLAVYSREVQFDDRLGILALLVMGCTLFAGGFSTFGMVAGAYFVLYLAARLPASVQWIGRRTDLSYGVYIYGFLVQQVTAYLGWHEWGLVPWILACAVISLGCAWVSWNVVERHAMALKDWGPGRGLRFWRDHWRASRAQATTREG